MERAKAWLRFLVEHPLAGDPSLRCQKCGGIRAKADSRPGRPPGDACEWCGGPTLLLDESYWGRVSKTILLALRRDSELLAQVKVEFGVVRFPDLPGPLSWLKNAWEQAGKPSGRPVQSDQHYRIESIVRMLTRPLGPVGREDHDEATRPLATNEDQDITLLQGGFGLTMEEALDVMSGTNFLAGEVRVVGGTGIVKRYAGLSGEQLNVLGKRVRQHLGNVPDRAEIFRSCQWVRRQRRVPRARLRGERVRARNGRRDPGVDHVEA
jgi:hypothetical protein